MTDDLKFPVTLRLTDQEGMELYRLLTELDGFFPTVIGRLHVALRERTVRNRL